MIRIAWPLYYCRQIVNRSGTEDIVSIHTWQDQVLLDIEDDIDEYEDSDFCES